ncbi:hypothetical protein AAVH_09679 [Aphelenchoides avenae]|nr:hypothetical protein AAVH_09679 [Aphelenchus avenae]
MLYHLRAEPLRRDVTRKEIEQLMGDFGTIYRVSIHRSPPYPRYNRITRKKDIFDPTYAVISYTDRHACRIAIANLHNTIKHPITSQFHSVVETVKMGQMEVRRSLRLYEHTQNRYGA